MALLVHKAIKDLTTLTVTVTLTACSCSGLNMTQQENTHYYTFWNSFKDTILENTYKVQQFFVTLTCFLGFKDINECSLQGVCQNGDCLNTLGSFKCSCKAGFVLERNICVGQYEAFLKRLPAFEQNKQGFNRTVCLSESPAEQAWCFRMVSEAKGCEHAFPIVITQEMCCCTVGKAWGRNCERCPQVGTGECASQND